MAEVGSVPVAETPTPTNASVQAALDSEADAPPKPERSEAAGADGMLEFPMYGSSASEIAQGRWSKEEDEALKRAVDENGARNWKRIASEFLGDKRTDVQCLHRWQKVLKPGLVKGPWTADEDETIKYCMSSGVTRWSEIAKRVPGRIGKQCRERWFNHLDPSIKRSEWTPLEDQKLIEGQALLGNKWSQIAKMFLPGRPENAVKNRWNAATRRRRTDSKSPTGSSLLAQAAAKSVSPAGGARQSKRRTGPNKAKAGSEFDGLEGMNSLASLCAVALDGKGTKARGRASKAKASVLSKEERKERREAEREAKKAAKEAKKAAKLVAKEVKKAEREAKKRSLDEVDTSASLGAAALLKAANELSEEPSKKKQRGSSFQASRPGLPAPGSISTLVAKSTNDMTTPLWTSPKPPGMSPSKAGEDAAARQDGLQFLSSLANARSTRASAKAMLAKPTPALASDAEASAQV